MALASQLLARTCAARRADTKARHRATVPLWFRSLSGGARARGPPAHRVPTLSYPYTRRYLLEKPPTLTTHQTGPTKN